MTKSRNEHGHPTEGEVQDTEGRRIKVAADETSDPAQNVVRSVADRATPSAPDTVERGRASVREAELPSRDTPRDRGGRDGTPPFATAPAVGSMGYGLATLML